MIWNWFHEEAIESRDEEDWTLQTITRWVLVASARPVYALCSRLQSHGVVTYAKHTSHVMISFLKRISTPAKPGLILNANRRHDRILSSPYILFGANIYTKAIAKVELQPRC